MKALSIQQPWVHAILHLGKDVENRTWTRKFRGWLAIHASGKPAHGVCFPQGVGIPELGQPDYFAICGVARVIDIVSDSPSKWFWRPDDGTVNFGWVLDDVTALKEPVAC